ncbi:hypothetical protein BANRA_05169 [Klebsiella pneumoniae]|nr:hypothetical protein BANRA_05169 [Klebsiella pneumoniae]
MKKLLIPLIAAGSLLYLPASHAEDPCKVIMCMAGKLTGDSGGSECNSAEAAFFNIVKKEQARLFTQPHEGCQEGFS